MKKFITYVSMLPDSMLFTCNYTADLPQLCAENIRFPVTAMVRGFAEPGEEIAIIAISERGNADCERNASLLSAELDLAAAEIGFRYTMHMVIISPEESAREHLNTFSAILPLIEDNDVIHACLTFGTKPTPIVEMMAMNFAYQVKQNVTIRCIAYGRLTMQNGQPVKAHIYDITPLFFMNELTNQLATSHVKSPEDFIRRMLQIGE